MTLLQESKRIVTNTHYSNWLGVATYYNKGEYDTKEEAQKIALQIRQYNRENARVLPKNGKYQVWSTLK